MSASREGAKGESSYAWKEDSKESFPLLYGGFIPSLCRGKMWETSSPSSHLSLPSMSCVDPVTLIIYLCMNTQ